jgi:hypothetical protein
MLPLGLVMVPKAPLAPAGPVMVSPVDIKVSAGQLAWQVASVQVLVPALSLERT